ncbi:MAG: hypothetical protein F4Y87_02845 [Synechococcus sp. SB0665_bin_28]|nr:hypothetical protein [Synechococcus sp. SB0665_bin_28]MYF19744.1 hypothetical protein [Synechococcus sp. SB0677_bin_5]
MANPLWPHHRPSGRVTLAGEERTNATALAENQEVLAKVLGFQTITPQQVAAGSAFSFSPQPAAEECKGKERPRLAVWGRGALSPFRGQHDSTTSLDGDVTTVQVGAEWSTEWCRAGAALPLLGP